MALTPEDVEKLDARAQAVGAKVGWGLRFVEAPIRDYIGVTADNIFIIDPKAIDELTVQDVDLDLDAIERGDRRIVRDEDGDPRLV